MKEAFNQHPNNIVMLALHNVDSLFLIRQIAKNHAKDIHGVTLNSHLANKIITGHEERSLNTLDIIYMLKEDIGIQKVFFDESIGRNQLEERMGDYINTVDYISVEATIGVEGMKRAVKKRDCDRKDHLYTKLIATTVLPEESDSTIRRTYGQSVKSLVANLTDQSLEAGMDGVAHSWHELDVTRQFNNENFLRVATGLRITPLPNDSRSRIMTIDDIESLNDTPDIAIIGAAVFNNEQPYSDISEPLQLIYESLKKLPALAR